MATFYTRMSQLTIVDKLHYDQGVFSSDHLFFSACFVPKKVYPEVEALSIMDLLRLWKTVLDEMELLITKPTFSAFFSTTHLVSVENGIAVIGCSNSVAVTMMETRYYSLIKNLLDKHTKQNVSVLFKVIPQQKATAKEVGPLYSSLPHTPKDTLLDRLKRARLKPDFSFASFAVSATNHLAYAAATAVTTTPGTSYNPLFFYGGVGVGKTHLMQAIGYEVVEKFPDLKVIYCTSEEFTNEIIEAMQEKNTRRFKDKYRSAKVLLIDDVQFLQGKIRVQEEFFYTFNSVVREGGQIVMTSDRTPSEIDNLEERLKSRFEAGLAVDVQNPDFELRCAILKIKAKQKGMDLPTNIAKVLAANAESARKLEGVLLRLLTEMSINKSPLTEELAQSIVGKPQTEELSTKKRMVSPKEVIDQVIKHYGVTLGQLRGTERSRPLARPRQVLMYLLRTELSLPLQEVGVLVGGRDHSTVLHAVSLISSLISTNDRFREDVTWIKRELFG